MDCHAGNSGGGKFGGRSAQVPKGQIAMMIRAVPTDPFSFGDIVAIVVGVLVVGAVIVCVSMSAEDSPPISEFLHRTQAEADASRFQELLGALNEHQTVSHPISTADRVTSSEHSTAGEASTAPVAPVPIKEKETKLSDRSDSASRSELKAMYERAMAPGFLKPSRAASGVRRSGLDL
jgi:hypothetical protein